MNYSVQISDSTYAMFAAPNIPNLRAFSAFGTTGGFMMSQLRWTKPRIEAMLASDSDSGIRCCGCDILTVTMMMSRRSVAL